MCVSDATGRHVTLKTLLYDGSNPFSRTSLKTQVLLLNLIYGAVH
jgi:hypothetical protein